VDPLVVNRNQSGHRLGAPGAHRTIRARVVGENLDDIERSAIAAHLAGDEAESRNRLARGYREALERKDVTRAVRFAFWIAHSMIFTGELGQGSGWLARARTLLAERGVDCVEWGYLLIPQGVKQLLEDAAAR
jgi:hypothetical protein